MTQFNMFCGNKKKRTLFLKLLILSFLFNNSAYAYFDPGSGAFIIQAIIAFFAVIMFYLGYPIRVLKNIFIKIKKIFFKVDDNDRKKNNLNFNAIISLSLLLCSNYYFFKDQWFEIDHFVLKEDYFLLFVFSIFFFLFFKKFSNLVQKLNHKIYILLIWRIKYFCEVIKNDLKNI